MPSSDRLPPRRHLAVVHAPAAGADGDYEFFRTRRLQARPEPTSHEHGPALERERLAKRRAVDVVACAVDAPVRPSSPVTVVLWGLFCGAAIIGVIAVIGMAVR